MPAMKPRRIVLHPRTREKLRRAAKRCKDADTRVRYLVVLRSADGWSGRRISKALGCCASTVTHTLDRWEAYGEAGSSAYLVRPDGHLAAWVPLRRADAVDALPGLQAIAIGG